MGGRRWPPTRRIGILDGVRIQEGQQAMSVSGAIDRLPFALPDFTRHSWVSDRARLTWEPRMARIRHAWSEVQWLSVVDKIRPCALVGFPKNVPSTVISRWSEKHLSAVSLPAGEHQTLTGTVYVAVGSLVDVRCAREAWNTRDDDALGRLLGYPECCRSFFQEVWVKQQSLDTTWAMATNTAAPAGSTVAIESGEANLANILWRWLGVRAVPHLPCSFRCKKTIQLGEELLQVATRVGYADEGRWLAEMLSWPIEWSALHGIAEIKTPLLKISTRTDATASKYTVQWKGTGYPAEGGTGVRFPYRAPARRPMTQGPSFQLGLQQSLNSTADARRFPLPVLEINGPGILEATLGRLPGSHLSARRIVRVRLTNYFNVVELDDGSVGAAMSYAQRTRAELEEERHNLERALASDPLLLAATSRVGDLLALSLRVSIVSALSAPAIRAGGDGSFTASSSAPMALFEGVSSAIVIGFGGYMDALARRKSIRELHVADRQYSKRRAEMDAAVMRYQHERPELRMRLSDGADTLERMATAELACISGSTLCNGTLEDLLAGATRCRTVIVQGQSASIHPGELLNRGVSLVSTTLKPRNLPDLADRDQLKTAMEGGLPTIYLARRKH
jgi:hypothetical protein